MTTTSATQPGVLADTLTAAGQIAGEMAAAALAATTAETTATTADTATEPVLTDRERVMEQITASNDARMAAEHAAAGIAPAPADTQEQQLSTQLEDKPTVLESGLDKIFVKQKIDGEERLVSVADMQRDSQKHGAADKRLDEAARLLREAREQTSAMKPPPVGIESAGASPDSTTQAPPEANGHKAALKELTSALFEGDEEKALEVMEKLGVGRPQPTPADPRQLVSQLAPAVKQQLSADSALEQFAKDYRDIVSDPYLASLADTFLEAEVQDPTKSYAEALSEAGRRTRDWLATKTGSAAANAPTMDRNQKLERKAGIDNIQALNTKAATVEEPVQSASDVIADMRRQRGLA